MAYGQRSHGLSIKLSFSYENSEKLSHKHSSWFFTDKYRILIWTEKKPDKGNRKYI